MLAAVQYLARLAVLQLDQPQKRIRDYYAIAMSTSSSPVRRETSRNLLAADDSGISGNRLNTVEARGYSPPVNCREQAGFTYSGEIVRKVEEHSRGLN